MKFYIFKHFKIETCPDIFDETGDIPPPPYLNSHTYNFTCVANSANITTKYKCLSNGQWDSQFKPCAKRT